MSRGPLEVETPKNNDFLSEITFDEKKGEVQTLQLFDCNQWLLTTAEPVHQRDDVKAVLQVKSMILL